MKMAQYQTQQTHPNNPFLLSQQQAYAQWRERKLAAFCDSIEALFVPIADPRQLRAEEKQRLQLLLTKHNFAFYRFSADAQADKNTLRQFAAQFGLQHLDNNICADEDSITSLQVNPEQGQRYIPYTNKPLSWHTDGYYNPPDKQVRAILMHCVRPAASGGINYYLDHEIAYLYLRDENPQYIEALMHPQALEIPANMENEREIRPAMTGPVFSLDSRGNLHMRYSARQRNIIWRDDTMTRKAAAFLRELMTPDMPHVLSYRLAAAEGVLSNNVLHNRSGFADSGQQTRLLYRARYYNRVAHTNINLGK